MNLGFVSADGARELYLILTSYVLLYYFNYFFYKNRFEETKKSLVGEICG